MKKIILLLTITFGLSNAAWSQTDVHLLINHRLGGADYAPSLSASNNLGDQFNIQRLDYYLAEIVLYHDGGQSTSINDHYILVKASQEGNLRLDSLGNYAINQLDSIRFGVGVDGGRNHSDISTYTIGHPLSYQSPSMHWGWAAGYRFVAIEGSTGANMSLGWQIHGLGDNNYGYCTVVTSGTRNGNNLTIALNADYEKALKDIAVTGSLNYHGSSGQAITLLNNLKSEVFSAGAGSIGLNESSNGAFSVYPNPSAGQVEIAIPNQSAGMHLEVLDLSGQLVELINLDKGIRNFELQSAGLYILQLCQGSEVLSSQKLIIQ